MSIKEDKYVLGQSEKKSIVGLGEEIRLDILLKSNPNLQAGVVSGIVKDHQGNPVSGALIKIMDSNHNPLSHALTGPTGNYTFSPFPPGTNYHIYAIAQGYSLEEGIPFTLLPQQSIIKDFTLTLDPDAAKGLIAGDVIATGTHAPIGGAAVNLYVVNALGEKTLVSLTFTNEFGQYTFRELDKESYLVTIAALGYVTSSDSILINNDGQIAHLVTQLTIDPLSARGTISGIITDEQNIPVSLADVVLYKIEADNTLKPIAFTKTNAEGLYLFMNVPQGDYKIKSNKTILVTI